MNLGAFGSGISGGYLAGDQQAVQTAGQRQINALRARELEQLGIQRAAQAASARALLGDLGSGPLPYAQTGPAPQQMQPGQPSVPMTPAGPPPVGMGPAAPAGPPAGPMPGPGPMAPGPGPAGPPPAAPQQPMARPAMGQPGPGAGMPAGQMTVQQLAQSIKRANPGIDDQTLFQAVAQSQALLNPQGKMELQFAIAQMRADMQVQQMHQRSEDLTRRLESSERNTDERIAAMRDGQQLRAQVQMQLDAAKDERQRASLEAMRDRLDSVLKERTDRAAATEAGKRERGLARTGERGVQAQFKAYAGDIQDINREITEIQNGARVDGRPTNKQENARIAELKQQRAGIRKTADDLITKAQGQGIKLSYRDAMAGDGDDAPAAPGAGAWAPPEGAPSAEGVKDGEPLKMDGKIIARAKGGKWVQAGEGGGGDAEPEGGGGGPVPAAKPARQRVVIRGRNAPSEVDAAWGTGPDRYVPGGDDGTLGDLNRARRGAGARSAQ
jgi:hypothetical protein